MDWKFLIHALYFFCILMSISHSLFCHHNYLPYAHIVQHILLLSAFQTIFMRNSLLFYFVCSRGIF